MTKELGGLNRKRQNPRPHGSDLFSCAKTLFAVWPQVPD